MSLLGVSTIAVNMSSLTESVISGEMAASTASGSAALVGTVPMALDTDSAVFAATLNATGGAYLGMAAEHVGQRMAFSGAQGLASVTYLLNELASAAQIAL